MNPRFRLVLQVIALFIVLAVLALIFPAAFKFAEGAARSIVRLWWLVLLVALALWLIWGVGRGPKNK
ncbi:MAG TPA: hypothetical protein VEH04_10570 [Verrucomicrobiae bacterium]|nr:hypothetical protein [Verrucomicrobiae bacterium]